MARLSAVLWALLAIQDPSRTAGRHVDCFGDETVCARAAADADAAGDRFRDLFGTAPARGAVVLTNGRPDLKDKKSRTRALLRFGARWSWQWERTTGPDPDETMTHELGHLWLIFWADGFGAPAARRYGSSLPDWFDEGVACLLEGPKMQRLYAATLKRRMDGEDAMSLARLFACVHPDSKEETKKEKAADRWLFYSQSWGVAAFLADGLGPEAFRRVAGELKAGRAFEKALGGKGLPKDLAAFEDAWKAWIRKREEPKGP
jgi:hypothetical protein